MIGQFFASSPPNLARYSARKINLATSGNNKWAPLSSSTTRTRANHLSARPPACLQAPASHSLVGVLFSLLLESTSAYFGVMKTQILHSWGKFATKCGLENNDANATSVVTGALFVQRKYPKAIRSNDSTPPSCSSASPASRSLSVLGTIKNLKWPHSGSCSFVRLDSGAPSSSSATSCRAASRALCRPATDIHWPPQTQLCHRGFCIWWAFLGGQPRRRP